MTEILLNRTQKQMWRAAKVFLLLPKVCVLNPICDLSHAIQCLRLLPALHYTFCQ